MKDLPVTTELLFRQDAYLRECDSTVIGHTPEGGILVDRTVFYATGGGQPGDCGLVGWEGGRFSIATAVKAEGGLVAECRPGKGQVILVADADLLHSALWQSALPGGDSSPNMDWTMQLLDRLERGSRLVGQRGEILE